MAFEDGSDVISPGQVFEYHLAMEELHDKLKILNYHTEFVRALKQKPISRHFFALQTNPGEQFYTFASLASWLVRKSGRSFEQPQEYDDPNSTISLVLDHARQGGATIDFPPTRLKQGHGEQVIYVLNCLANHALSLKQPSGEYKRASPKEETSETAPEVEDDSELILEKVEEELGGLSGSDNEEDDDEGLNFNDLRNIQLHQTLLQQQRSEHVLQSSVRFEEWQAEVERVLPQLRVTVQADAGDWRSHLEEMQKHRASLSESLKSSQPLFNKMQTDIRSALDKIDNREKHLNGQLEHLLVEYRDKQNEFSNVMEQYKTVNSGVTDRTKILGRLAEELDSIKKETEERSSAMTDGSPLINAKKAVSRLSSEVKELDVRLGVLDNEILQTRLRHRAMDHLEAANSTLVY